MSDDRGRKILDLNQGVVFAVIRQSGRTACGTGHVRTRYAAVNLWVEGKITRVINYNDTGAPRSRERLAKDRE